MFDYWDVEDEYDWSEVLWVYSKKRRARKVKNV
jgi:hypothetical protein